VGRLPRRGGQAQRRRAKVSSGGGSRRQLIPTAKAGGQYLNSVLAKIEADKAGYEEAILLDTRGYVCEGTGENLFLVKDGKSSTPGLRQRHPRGHQPLRAIEILRDQGYEVDRARHRARRALPRRRDLHDRHGGELTPIREVDDLTVGYGTRGRSRPRSRRSSRTRCTAFERYAGLAGPGPAAARP
jgi:branched-chain amino acid aminotransferase